MRGRPSVWWPTRSRPEDHFSADQLDRSAAHHEPLRRVVLATAVVRFVLLTVAAAIGGVLSDRWADPAPDGDRSWTSEGLVDTATSPELLVAAALVAVAIRLPASVSDTWFEYRFGRGSPDGPDGHQPVAPPAFAATGLAMAVGLWLVLGVAGAVGYHAASVGLGPIGRPSPSGWIAIVAVVVVVLLVAVAAGERPVRRRFDGERSLDGTDEERSARSELGEVAGRFGIKPEVLHVVDRSDGQLTADGDRSMMAAALGLGPSRRVVIDRRLLDVDHQLRHFVVAHEFAHLARHHVVVRVLTAGVGAVALAVIVVGALADGRLWRWFGLAPAEPLGLALVALVAMAAQGLIIAPTAWLSRAQERSADAVAASVVPVPSSAALSRMYVEAAVDLDPPRWVRMLTEHPPSGERLELLSRHRRLEAPLASGPGFSPGR